MSRYGVCVNIVLWRVRRKRVIVVTVEYKHGDMSWSYISPYGPSRGL